MNGYEKRTKIKTEKILQTAQKLFAANGIEKTTIDEIAQKAQVAPATIYNYFKTKEQLVVSVAQELIDTSLKEKKKLWNSELPFDQLLEKAFKNQELFLKKSNLELLETFFRENEDVSKQISDAFEKEYPALLESFIQKGKNEGYIQREISSQALMLYLKMYQDMIKQPEAVSMKNQQVLKELYDLLLYGLIGK